jgi:hypothetical protein
MNDAKPTRSGFAVAILGALAAFAFLGLTIAYKYTGDFTGLRHTVPLGNNTPLLTMLVPLTSSHEMVSEPWWSDFRSRLYRIRVGHQLDIGFRKIVTR